MNLHLQVFLLFQGLFRLRRPPLLRLRLLIELLRLVPWPGLLLLTPLVLRPPPILLFLPPGVGRGGFPIL